MLLTVEVCIAVLIRIHEIYYAGKRKGFIPYKIILRRLALKVRLLSTALRHSSLCHLKETEIAILTCIGIVT